MCFLLNRLLKFIITFTLTLFLVTASLYAVVMLTPPESRASLFMPKRTSPRMTEEQYQKLLEQMIEKHHLNDPYPVQYYYWVRNLLKGEWGYSPTLQGDVLTAIIRRTPETAELTLYSLLLFIPAGLYSGVLAGLKKNRIIDHSFRLAAFVGTFLPSFILAILMMVSVYIDLHWFAPGKSSTIYDAYLASDQFRNFTGLLTIDGLLNRRPDITLDALRHLAMPAFTLAFAQWATLGRLTRAMLIEEMQQDYIVAARARGLSETRIAWGHALRNVISPVFTNTMLTAASLLTGVFIVEIIFNYPGISYVALKGLAFVADAAAAMGFAIYSVVIVLILMGILDFCQLLLDPRMRENM